MTKVSKNNIMLSNQIILTNSVKNKKNLINQDSNTKFSYLI